MLALPAPSLTDQKLEIERPSPSARSKAGAKAVAQSVSTAKLEAVAPLQDVLQEAQPGVMSTNIEVIPESKVEEIDQGVEKLVVPKTLDAGPSASALKDAAASKQPDAVEVNAALEQALSDRDATKQKAQGGTCMRKPASAVKKQPPALKKPAACKAKPVAKPAACKAKAASSVKKQPPAVKKPAAATKKPKWSKGPIPEGRQRFKLKPKGCSKCRKRAGCCDSCWVGRGYYRKG